MGHPQSPSWTNYSSYRPFNHHSQGILLLNFVSETETLNIYIQTPRQLGNIRSNLDSSEKKIVDDGAYSRKTTASQKAIEIIFSSKPIFWDGFFSNAFNNRVDFNITSCHKNYKSKILTYTRPLHIKKTLQICRYCI